MPSSLLTCLRIQWMWKWIKRQSFCGNNFAATISAIWVYFLKLISARQRKAGCVRLRGRTRRWCHGRLLSIPATDLNVSSDKEGFWAEDEEKGGGTNRRLFHARLKALETMSDFKPSLWPARQSVHHTHAFFFIEIKQYKEMNERNSPSIKKNLALMSKESRKPAMLWIYLFIAISFCLQAKFGTQASSSINILFFPPADGELGWLTFFFATRAVLFTSCPLQSSLCAPDWLSILKAISWSLPGKCQSHVAACERSPPF